MSPKLEEAILLALKTPAAKTKLEKGLAFFNSEFFRTAVMGVVLAIVPLYVQKRFAADTEQRTGKDAQTEKQRQLLSKFADGITRIMSVADGMRKREIWLGASQKIDSKEKLKYPDERDFTETRDEWELEKKQYQALPAYNALCAEALVYFQDSGTQVAIRSLNESLDMYFDCEDFEPLEKLRAQIVIQTDKAVKLMGKSVTIKN